MCGIAGKLWFDPNRPAAEETVRAMLAALVHRGPDDQGLNVEGPLALGQRRLAIVDLSPAGRQPMTSADGQLFVAVNGEIYNHQALRKELGARGHQFSSQCDSEVLLPLYREYWEAEGPRFVDRLEGMFAFALWDAHAQRLILGRDRVGQKPLVYTVGKDGLSFASELSALKRDPDLDRRVDDQALADYLAFRCIPQPRTIWRGARKLPPGHVLVSERGQTSLTRYWQLVPGPEQATSPSFEEAVDEVGSRLDRAVERRLMSDVPLGALLSGGLDSAAIVAHMAARSGGRVSTFTIGFEEAEYDETGRARSVARLFDTNHHEELVLPDAVSLLDQLVEHHGEPFADSSSIPTWLVSQLASQHVKVVLTGDGGDESFAGYDRYKALRLARCLEHGWAAPARGGVRLARRLAMLGGGGGHRSLGTRLDRFCRALDAPERSRNHLWRLATPPDVLARLLQPEALERWGDPTHYGPDGPSPLGLNEALALDVAHYLPDDVLVKVDINSMAHSLEARSPLLDRELMEYAAALPARFKLCGRQSKHVLRTALRRMLPQDVLRGPKQGFGVPLDAWFRGPLGAHAEDVLLSPEATARGLFDSAAVGRLLRDHREGKVAAHETLYTLLVLERWFHAEDTGP